MADEDPTRLWLDSRYMQEDEKPMVRRVITALQDIGMHPVDPEVAAKIAAALGCHTDPCNPPPDDGEDGNAG